MFKTGAIKFFEKGDKPYGKSMLDLVKIWYQTALSIPNIKNPLMGDDIDGKKSKKFRVKLNARKNLLICGGAFERAALAQDESHVFLRKVKVDIGTVLLVSILNVILPPGGHDFSLIPKMGKEKALDLAYNQVQESMISDKVTAMFKITDLGAAGRKPIGIVHDKTRLLYISTPKKFPLRDIKQHPKLAAEPKGEPELLLEPSYPLHTAGYYACIEITGKGRFILDVDGKAPLAGEQEDFFWNSAQYEVII